MRRIDYLLVLGIALSPMTLLRLGKIGPAELLAFAWCVLALLNARTPVVPGRFGRVLGAFLVILIAGTLHGVAVTPAATQPTGLLTWFYLSFIGISGFAVLQGRQTVEIDRLLSTVGAFSTLWFGALYLYSATVSTTILGIDLWYSTARFAGGADNPHQLSLLMAACIFINFRHAVVADTKRRRGFALLLTGLAIFIGYQTTSATLTVAVAITAAVTGVHLLLDRIHSRTGRSTALVLVVVVTIIIGALQWQRILELATRFMDSDDNGWGRLTLWQSFNDIIGHVLVLGLGPGTYAENGQMEFHNSYLELAAMLGLPAAVLALVCLVQLLRRLARTHWTIMTILLALLVYAIPGFGIRRLLFWLIVAVCLALATALDRQATTDARSGSASEHTPDRDAGSPTSNGTVATDSFTAHARRADPVRVPTQGRTGARARHAAEPAQRPSPRRH